MLKKRFLAGFLFGLSMFTFMWLLQYASSEIPREPHLLSITKIATITGLLSGTIVGALLGKWPKKRYD